MLAGTLFSLHSPGVVSSSVNDVLQIAIRMKSIFSVAVFVWVAAVSCDAYRYKPSCRKVEAHDRVSCGYPGISRKECLKDCHCCFDSNAYNSKTQCFFRDPPPATELCCKVKRRVACRLKGRDLDNDPYTCRQLGCCFDAGVDDDQPQRRRRRKRRGYGNGRRRPGKYDYGGRGYGQGKRYRYGGSYDYGYGDWSPPNQPRCFKTRRNCCRQLIKHVDPDERKMASLGSVTRRQCLRNRNACWDNDNKPQCFYKFKPCRCPVKSLKCKPCGDDFNQHRLDRSHSKCVAAGCCYRAAAAETKCIKPRRLMTCCGRRCCYCPGRRRFRNAADEDYGMDDMVYFDDYNYIDDDDNDNDSAPVQPQPMSELPEHEESDDDDDDEKEEEEQIQEDQADKNEAAEEIREMAEKFQQAVEKIPEAVEEIPEKAQETPQTAAEIPEAVENILEAREKIPQRGKEIPEAVEEIPKTAEEIPEAVEEIPDTAEKIPEAAEEIPEAAEKIPETAGKIPEAAEKIPEAAEEIPEAAEEIPKVAKEIPEAQEQETAKRQPH